MFPPDDFTFKGWLVCTSVVGLLIGLIYLTMWLL